EPQVRAAAATALGEIGGEPAIRALAASLWDSTSLIQPQAAAALMRIGPAAIPALTPGLQAADPQVAQITRWMLVMISGQSSAEASAGTEAPQAAADVKTHIEVLVDRLEKASMSRDRAAGRDAACQLCDSSDPACWEALVTPEVQWDDEISATAAEALTKLCRFGDECGRPPEAALAVLERLEEDESEDAVEVLRRALGHASPDVRSRSLRVLNDWGEPPIDDDEKRLRALIDGDWDTVEALGPGTLTDILIAQLGDNDRYHRKDAAEALGKLKDRRAGASAADAPGGTDPGGRAAARRVA